ncbi:MAG TPA: LUD domain-containing protein [Hypericibacter adhaerens]|uniref:LutC/YkgG family protein n=1 Tax=Hypericibacter adhaerens TaxID=2602016 RepID=UPI002C500043|nr:LUD domain-containing protein [Hypericibacter adhaerens]HWA41977.1 LUD domain-containing protein [Hypericibacter adhaerens]
MSDARAEILGRLRRALKRDALAPAAAADIEARLAAHAPGPVPARTRLDREGLIALFGTKLQGVAGTVERLGSLDQVPGAVARYLARHNLPAALKLAPAPMLTQQIDWSKEPLLKLSSGPSDGSDLVALTAAFAGIAETGTLMLTAGPETPTTLNFLPDDCIVLLPLSRLVGPFEEAWARLRAATGGGLLPRTVNLVTGPSRSADIGLVPQLGAHGPRRLHVLLVDDDTQA